MIYYNINRIHLGLYIHFYVHYICHVIYNQSNVIEINNYLNEIFSFINITSL